MSSAVFRFDEKWDFPDASPEEVFDVLARGKLLPEWWKGVYLEAEELEPGTEPHVGGKVRAKARGFLPYQLNFIIEMVELERPRLVAVKVVGDFDGRWRAALSPKDGGTHVDLTWETELKRAWMKTMAPLLRPVFAWNHYWTTPRGEAGLRAYLAKHRKSAVAN
jgi:uncharacterized protein YndB with AHSA1/START domain